VPGGALTAADFRKAAEAGGFTGNIIVGNRSGACAFPRSKVDQLRQALPVSRRRQHRHRRDAAYGISCQAKCVNSGVRPTALYRKTETGEGRLSSTETVGVFIAIPITDPGGGQIMARDVTGGLEGALISLMDNFVVGFEKCSQFRSRCCLPHTPGSLILSQSGERRQSSEMSSTSHFRPVPSGKWYDPKGG